eukprot:1194655-Prorocentrum_minimum.AAC.3
MRNWVCNEATGYIAVRLLLWDPLLRTPQAECEIEPDVYEMRTPVVHVHAPLPMGVAKEAIAKFKAEFSVIPTSLGFDFALCLGCPQQRVP